MSMESFVQSERDRIWAKGLRVPGPILGGALMLLGPVLLASGWMLDMGWIWTVSQSLVGLGALWQGFVIFGYDKGRD